MTTLNNEIRELNSHELDEVSGGWGATPGPTPPHEKEIEFLFEMRMAKLWSSRMPPNWQHPVL